VVDHAEEGEIGNRGVSPSPVSGSGSRAMDIPSTRALSRDVVEGDWHSEEGWTTGSGSGFDDEDEDEDEDEEDEDGDRGTEVDEEGEDEDEGVDFSGDRSLRATGGLNIDSGAQAEAEVDSEEEAGARMTVPLQPFDHAVGGHSSIYKFTRRAVCKVSASSNEN
jgi:hypothetical protein